MSAIKYTRWMLADGCKYKCSTMVYIGEPLAIFQSMIFMSNQTQFQIVIVTN